MRVSLQPFTALALLLSTLTACKSSSVAAAQPDANATASCKHDPECVPAKSFPEQQGVACSVRGTRVSCSHCGPKGQLLQCLDTNEDGCLELVRMECGRPNGCENPLGSEARCKVNPNVAENQFGFLAPGTTLPKGFVPGDNQQVVEVRGHTLTAVVKTRNTFSGVVFWSVSLQGGGLDIPARPMRAEFLDVQDDLAIATHEINIDGLREQADNVRISFALGDARGRLQSTFFVKLKRVE